MDNISTATFQAVSAAASVGDFVLRWVSYLTASKRPRSGSPGRQEELRGLCDYKPPPECELECVLFALSFFTPRHLALVRAGKPGNGRSRAGWSFPALTWHLGLTFGHSRTKSEMMALSALIRLAAPVLSASPAINSATPLIAALAEAGGKAPG